MILKIVCESLTIYISSLIKYLFVSGLIFSLDFVFLFMLTFEGFLYSLDISPFIGCVV